MALIINLVVRKALFYQTLIKSNKKEIRKCKLLTILFIDKLHNECPKVENIDHINVLLRQEFC